MKARRLFRWQAVDAQGELRQGAVLVEAKPQVYLWLIEQGLQPCRVGGGKRIGARQWRGEALIQFTRQLATLLQAGLPLVNTLQLLAQEHPCAAWRCLLADLGALVAQGQPFSEAIADYPQIFPQVYRQLIAIGELTGNLDRCCWQLAQQQDQQQKLQKKVVAALRYPLFVCTVALLVSIVMLVMVLPEFAKVYQSFDAPLPWFTQGLLALSSLLIDVGPYLLTITAGVVAGYWRYLHPHSDWQRREQRLLLRLPLIARLIAGGCLSQIFRTLNMTQLAGLTLVDGLNAARLAIDNPFFRQALESIQQQLAQGVSFHRALGEQPLFPALCQQLVRVGEASGTLDTLLGKLAQWHEQQTHELADTLAQTLEPVLMLTVGAIVGGLVIAMYLPIFQLGNVLG
ncbi:protein transport protein HofC [Serratia odorifera]|jgi:protein transport protein HofC|uniref:Bacterial type II secretion system domain protein F n=2 Tax=Serratia odorifera TaxID=618 RepID=D4DX48_SEROD|nr:protein transport protein HofC [Serratia odorifera]EFE97914.1 bacterial type II secretion system domain protein F [Serratia odorifera DSM 4582]MBJ2065417.1 protein transport protein HofC [Serratia odorifera]PNK92295.1 type IV pilin biogenesis protein [Serratia odorifera]RII73359.1 type IV pilin biogenesis protein [Serratia odorifera]VDZ52520.1 type IV pilin biogenesis protein [Serratia odorifera]